MFLTSIPDKKSAAKACCWSAARGHTSPCASGRNAEVCPPAVSLQPAVTTWIIEHQFRLLADDAPPYMYNLLARGRSNKTRRKTNPSQRISWLCHTSNNHSMRPHSHLPNADIPVLKLNIQWYLLCTAQSLCLSPPQPRLALSYQLCEPSVMHTYMHTHKHQNRHTGHTRMRSQ